MTGAQLSAWQRRCGFRRDSDAANAVGLGVAAYRRKRKGRSPVDRQTELLTQFYEIHSVRWMLLAETIYKLHRLGVPMNPIAREVVAEAITAADAPSTLRR